MNRVIKFRAWITETVDDNDNPVFAMLYPDRLAISEYGLLSDQLRSTDNCVFMQFTGLQDANGVDIYEGDFVKHDAWDYPFEIIFNNEKARFVCKMKTGLTQYISNKEVVVVGNIHENPELI